MSLIFPIDAKLKDGSPVQLVLADQRDIEPLKALYRVIVEEGMSYPHDRFPGAVRKNDGTYQDAIIMFRSLEGTPSGWIPSSPHR